jgi:GH25 family lysozyme M1 (1,4-beta-N-acetylmuramidase)
VDLARAKPHGDFVFLKATDGKKKGGAMFVDRTFALRWRRLADLGIPRGAYHNAGPNTSPATQAAHFIAVVQASGFQAVFYTGIPYWTGQMGDPPRSRASQGSARSTAAR